jgi:hypothetical protein
MPEKAWMEWIAESEWMGGNQVFRPDESGECSATYTDNQDDNHAIGKSAAITRTG